MEITVEAPAGFEDLPLVQRKRIETSFRKELARKTLIDLLENGPGAVGYSEEQQLRMVEEERQAIWDEKPKA